MHVSVGIVRAIVAELVQRGISAHRFCMQAGVDSLALEDGTNFVTVYDFDRIAHTALRLSGDPALGLYVGANAPARSLHVVGQLLLSSRTPREAIEAFRRFAPLILPEARWELREGGELAYFVYDHPLANPTTSRFGTELTLAMVYKIGEQLLGPRRTMRAVCCRHEAPSYAAEYERVFRAPPSFGEAENRLVFDRAFLDVPQLHGDERMFHLMRSRAEQMLLERVAPDRLPDRVRDLLRCEPDLSSVDGQHIARRLGMTLRALRRRLGELGTPLSTLLDEVRQELACEALRDPNASIKEVAERLGFSEPSAFHRAFKRWTGHTPAQWRAEQGAHVLHNCG